MAEGDVRPVQPSLSNLYYNDPAGIRRGDQAVADRLINKRRTDHVISITQQYPVIAPASSNDGLPDPDIGRHQS
ncbi:hypothetical protein DPMN_192224 [Dreissena polymorpha]|uniref:Uncharacterized protein n=1 Tax=Dreissena polymorpha TaxID=45954 RepID=A0A9D4BCN4_DREPO|nr:hypothetical protein DPMN_192224 [Dreissena polymorpha]